MSDEQTVCGGRLEDGSRCEVCYFDNDLREWLTRVSHWLEISTFPRNPELVAPVHFCPVCGTRLSLSEDGEPVRGEDEG